MRILTNPHHFLTLSSAWMQTEWNNCWTINGMGKISRANRGLVLRQGHAQKCVERYCELANKKVKQLYKVSSLCLDDHVRQEEIESVGELSEVCSQIVLKCLHLARIGRPDMLWSVNKLARSVTKWTQACDRRLARLISQIHHTIDCRQYCHVGNTAQHCRLGLFQDSDFAGDREDSKSTQEESCVFLEVEHLFRTVGCARSKLLSRTVPQSLRLFLWMPDCVWMGYLLLILGILCSKTTFNQQQCPTHTYKHSGNWCDSSFQNQFPESQKKTEGWSIEWCGSCALQHTFFSKCVSVAHFWRQQSRVQNGNKRTMSMRRVSRTHRVAFDWLFDRINSDTRNPNQTCWPQKPTPWHSDQRMFLRRRIESLSLFDQNHEFLDVFLKPFQWFSFWRSG